MVEAAINIRTPGGSRFNAKQPFGKHHFSGYELLRPAKIKPSNT